MSEHRRAWRQVGRYQPTSDVNGHDNSLILRRVHARANHFANVFALGETVGPGFGEGVHVILKNDLRTVARDHRNKLSCSDEPPHRS